MITISVCMIVLNEETNLGICLKSLQPVADEIIVVDTGSTDRTKEVARKFTDKVYDFAWTGSFADARNFAFSKATCDYIYSADADESLDDENVAKILQMKQVLLPEIDIVQMYYCNQLENNTIYNFDKELRPKLYKRLREWTWEEIIHEAVRLDPIIYDSDIEIIHRPGPGHASRDLAAFRRLSEKEMTESSEMGDDSGDKTISMSPRLIDIYCKELYIAGTDEDFSESYVFFRELSDREGFEKDLVARIFAVCARACRIKGDMAGLMKYVTRAAAGEMMCSELCCELAEYMVSVGDMNEAALWYLNALQETEALMNIAYGNDIPRNALTELGVVL